MSSGVYLRKYGEAATVNFVVYEPDGVDLELAPAWAAGDAEIYKDEGTPANTTNIPVDEGAMSSLTLTATEMQAARILIRLTDQGTKQWLDRELIIETYGHASAQHAFDLDTATQGVDVTQISGDSTAADNLEADYDGTGYNKSNSTIGTTTTNTDMRGTDNAALASVVGTLADAAAAGDPTASDTIMQYIKQLVNVLVGTTGVTTYPAEAAPANNVSLAEVLRAIHADVTGLNGDAMRGTDSAMLATEDGSSFTAIPWNANWDTEVQSECNDALVAIGLDHLVSASVAGTDITDNSIIAYLASSSATADWDSFVNTTDSLQALRDNQGGGGDATAANQTTIINHLTDVKGTGFAKDTHSLTDITADVTGLNGDAMRGTDSALLAASAPTNFGDLAITVTTGQVTVGTNNDKAGYSISGTKTTLDALNDLAATDITSDGSAITMSSSGVIGTVNLVNTTTTNTDMLTAAAVNAEVVDVVNVDTLVAGVTLAEAVRRIGTITSGTVSGAGSGTETFTPWDSGAETVVVTVDGSGNRTGVTHN